MNKTEVRILENIGKKNNLKLLILFGSRARKDHNKDSDYDIAILDKYYDEQKSLNIINEIENLFNSNIDLINLNKTKDPLVRNIIAREGICIFESEKGLFDEFQIDSIFDYIDYKPLYKIEEQIMLEELNNI